MVVGRTDGDVEYGVGRNNVAGDACRGWRGRRPGWGIVPGKFVDDAPKLVVISRQEVVDGWGMCSTRGKLAGDDVPDAIEDTHV